MSNSKNILILTSEFPPLPGGIGNHAINLALYLNNNGYNISIIADQRSQNLKNDLDFDSNLPLDVIRIERRKPTILTYLNRITKTFSLVRQNKIIFASGKFPLWLVAIISLFFKSKTFVAILHGSELGAGGKTGKSLTKWSLKKYNKLIAVSNFTKELALQRQPNINIKVINNGFSPKNNTSNIFQKDDNISIITVGNVTSRKGQQNVIKALPEIIKLFPDVIYHVIGLPTQKEEFLELAKQFNVENTIIFHGALSDEQLHKTLSESTVFFMLSDHLSNGDVEGFGIAVLEANNLGLPAIGSKNSGISDAISDGFSGKLVNPHNPEEITQALSEIINDYGNYTARAVKWSENFHWENIIGQYLEVIEK